MFPVDRNHEPELPVGRPSGMKPSLSLVVMPRTTFATVAMGPSAPAGEGCDSEKILRRRPAPGQK